MSSFILFAPVILIANDSRKHTKIHTIDFFGEKPKGLDMQDLPDVVL